MCGVIIDCLSCEWSG